MDGTSIPPSSAPCRRCYRRCSDVSDSNMASDEGNSSISTNVDCLPEELLFKILQLLPADFLHNSARFVCPRWKKIIESQAFINTHINRHSTYGLLLTSQRNLTSQCSPVYVSCTQGRIETRELSYNYRSNFSILTCSGNGLAIELEGYNYSLRVINPATKQQFLLPSVSDGSVVSYYYRHCGIAYSAASMNKFKLTLPYFGRCLCHGYQQCPGLYILTLGVDKSLRNIEVDYLSTRFRRLLGQSYPLTTEGFLHWREYRCVLTLNVETEIFTYSEIPKSLDGKLINYYLSAGKYLSLLCYLGDFWWKIWEMKPEEESGEWRKLRTLKIDLKSDEKWTRLGHFNHLAPLGRVKYPEILALTDERETCVFYNLDTHEINTIKLADACGYAHMNSLVWFN